MLYVPGLLIYFYLATGTVYLLILALAGRWAKHIEFQKITSKKKIIVLIPAYKEDSIIIETAASAARHNYPASFFQVLVIADSLQEDTIEKLRKIPVRVLEVKFHISTKAKAIYAALTAVKSNCFEIAVILDADNIMQEGCLEQINAAFHHDCKAIQCHRSAKNQDKPIAYLDAISEEININLFRRGPQALGLSAMPLGSAMAFQFNLLNDIFETPGIRDNPAEDREIEIQLMKRQLKMVFLNNVYVYDEKVAETEVFQTQRTRWLEAQLNHVRRFFKTDLKNISKTAGYYNIFFQSLILPRSLYLVICFIITLLLILQWLFHLPIVYPASGYWICWIMIYFFVLLISIPFSYYTFKTLRAVCYIPLLMISMLKAIFKLKRNRKEFLHTSKTYNIK